MRSWIVFLCFFITVPAYSAPDYAREKEWAREIAPNIVVGDPIYLKQKNGHQFLGIYAQAAHPKMGVVIAHGMGLNPDWGVIGTIRQRLVDYGYTTLSIQMPVLARNAGYKDYVALFPDAAERLKIAVAYLKAKGYRRIAVVSHSNGSRMSRVYMVTNPPDVDAWVALSLTRGDTFAGVKVPILDLYGGNDLSHVLASVPKRKASFINSQSKQVVIPGADHFYRDHEEQVVTAIKNFLDQLALSGQRT